MEWCFEVNKKNKKYAKKYIEKLYKKGYSWPSRTNFFPIVPTKVFIFVNENIKQLTYGHEYDYSYKLKKINFYPKLELE